ncbi:MAG: hypothetical protein WAO83_17955 [Fuerstiella sp.]
MAGLLPPEPDGLPLPLLPLLPPLPLLSVSGPPSVWKTVLAGMLGPDA